MFGQVVGGDEVAGLREEVVGVSVAALVVEEETTEGLRKE
jgi:hypothetical protein